ncbi:MAG: adenosylcobinamide-GDP ribazoletransferase [Vicinamibacterales bacterium]
MKGLIVATAFLTRVPLPLIAGAVDVGRAARWFPLIGGAIGGAGALVAWGAREVIGLPPLLSATLLVGLGAWVTGAIHLDGLADTADGFGGGRSRDDVLRIMRDPAIGSFGATALVLVITTKVTALAVLLERGAAIPFLVAAPAISRWTIAALAAWLPYARAEGGLGQAVTRGQNTMGFLIATAIMTLIASAALRVDAIVAWTLAVLTMALLARAARHRIGGVTGDVFGASVELTETVVLIGGVLLTGRA